MLVKTTLYLLTRGDAFEFEFEYFYFLVYIFNLLIKSNYIYISFF